MTDLRLEYPRPQFVRKDWLPLNGEWDFTVDNSRTGLERGFSEATSFDKKISVPYCPESRLSGLELKDFMYGVWYTRTFTVPGEWLSPRRTFINIGACDYITRVFINGNEVGMHRGGYVSFSFEITQFLHEGENRVTVYAEDDNRQSWMPMGKQSDKFRSYNCFYTRTTGIWQSVWLENTPAAYIKSVKMTPVVADNCLVIEARTSAAELCADITRAQALGYNGARLHEKIFEPRFLYHADRLGYIVWGEYPNWGLDCSLDACYKNMVPEWLEELERDYNHPSIIGWCPLNETQRNIDPEFVRFIYNLTKAYDPTRLFIDNSGWHHIPGTYDMFDVHDYCGDPEEFRAKYWPLAEGGKADYMDDNDADSRLIKQSDEICFVSEFGGARWVVDDTTQGNNWGYGEQVKDVNAFIERYKGLVDALLDNPHISAFCYTQLTDVEQEQNGLYTYSRHSKFDPDVIKAITSRKAAIEE